MRKSSHKGPLTLWVPLALGVALGVPCAALGESEYQKGLAAFDAGNFEQALEIWLPLAQEGLAEAQFGVALAYQNGLGTVQDEDEALHWTRRAARQGLPAAQNNLGVIYATGKGVSPDPEIALSLWRQAAAEGHAGARANLEASLEPIGGSRAPPASPPEPSKAPTPRPLSGGEQRMPPSPDRSVRVQLASLESSEAAANAMRNLTIRHADLLDGAGLEVQRVDLGSQGIWYRVMLAPVPRHAAARLCEGVRVRAGPEACLILAEAE